MEVIFGTWFYLLLALIATCALGIHLYIRHIYSYWSRRNVPFAKPTFPFGNLKGAVLSTTPFIEIFKNLYYSTNEKVLGIYTADQPALMIRDPELLRLIFVKDFNYFTDHGVYSNEVTDPLSSHLFAINGDKWRNLRAQLSPTFSSGRLKGMFKTLLDCGKNFEVFVNQNIDEEIEIRDLMSCYSINVISSVAFGVDTDTIMNPNAIFKKMGKKFFEPTIRTTIRYACFLVLPHIGKLFGIRSVVKEYEDIVFKLVKDTTTYREKHNIQRRDFMQLLLQLKNTGKVDTDDNWSIQATKPTGEPGENLMTLSFNELAAQAHLFFLAGFETASTTITFCIYELARHPEIQVKVQEEIDDIMKQHNGEVTYEGLHEMKYLDRCLMETLRMYTPVIILNRQCVKDYELPGTGITLEKGTRLIIPAHAIHSDPKHFPQPDVFNPDRFVNENLNTEEKGVTFMPFGEGPRNCIGLRLGKIETKIAIILLLAKFNVRVGKRLEGVSVLKHERRSFTPQIEGGTFIKFSRRT
ncbi:hypothetical protein DMENIID0001_169980 [Sergentomyia squamirostris]